MTNHDIDRADVLAATVRITMDAFRRRLRGRPGHQSVTPLEMVLAARKDLAEIERIVREEG